ncbi:protein NipSnap [Planococcus citri]|uniref:protein NipSnap n=1 Tax=Planococcus citri TaxID=170843 RepID=UPI0031F73F98
MLKTFVKSKAVNVLASQNVRYISTGQPLNDESWLNKLFVRRIEPTKESHSSMLSDKEIIYALYTHNIKPDCRDKYLINCEKKAALLASLQKQTECDLVGAWTVEIGDLDQALHLWRFKGGYYGVDKARKFLDENSDFQKLEKEQAAYLRERHLQFLLGFSYWPKIENRPGRNIYEIRSYTLKPGTMIEWGNNWARAVNFRQNNNEAFAGFFSQIGRLYNVHHIWCYKNLNSRKETRESAWRSPGWDECVAYTVPLIQHMQSRLLLPTSFSPTK